MPSSSTSSSGDLDGSGVGVSVGAVVTVGADGVSVCAGASVGAGVTVSEEGSSGPLLSGASSSSPIAKSPEKTCFKSFPFASASTAAIRRTRIEAPSRFCFFVKFGLFIKIPP